MRCFRAGGAPDADRLVRQWLSANVDQSMVGSALVEQGGLDLEQTCQHSLRWAVRLDNRDAVAVLRLHWVGPGGGAPPGRPPKDFQPDVRKPRQRRLQEGFRRAVAARKVAAQGDDDGLIEGPFV